MTNFLTAKWEHIIMANYVIDPEILKKYIPKGVEIDYFEGKSYISLVGFLFKDTSIFKIPIPGLGTFEEINLRFYVKRMVDGVARRGVVFINETVPYKIVAFIANFLYKEHYISIPTKRKILQFDNQNSIKFEWKKNNNWNSMWVETTKNAIDISNGSIEEYIYEHYYGYTKVDNKTTLEYEIIHPCWKIYTILKSEIKCNFESMYSTDFGFLSNKNPESIMIAEGSNIAVKWNRKKI